MSSHILILGKDGQVGRSLTRLLGARAIAAGSTVVNLLHKDFTGQIESVVASRPLSAVINAAAYTKVDLAEGEGRNDAFRINAQAVGELAAWCKKRDLPLVHYSTDYVLGGDGQAPQDENTPTNPLNAYGLSKLEGEQAILAEEGKFLIFRTSWVYDAAGKNFVMTILRLIKERESLNIVSDQVGAPTYAPHLAKATLDALERSLDVQPFPSGVYHLCNAGEASWYDLASAIFMLAREYESKEYVAAGSSGLPAIKCQQISPIPTSAYPTPAKRPFNSRLDTAKVQRLLGVAMPEWEQGLKECFERIYGSSGLQTGRVKGHTA